MFSFIHAFLLFCDYWPWLLCINDKFPLRSIFEWFELDLAVRLKSNVIKLLVCICLCSCHTAVYVDLWLCPIQFYCHFKVHKSTWNKSCSSLPYLFFLVMPLELILGWCNRVTCPLKGKQLVHWRAVAVGRLMRMWHWDSKKPSWQNYRGRVKENHQRQGTSVLGGGKTWERKSEATADPSRGPRQ